MIANCLVQDPCCSFICMFRQNPRAWVRDTDNKNSTHRNTWSQFYMSQFPESDEMRVRLVDAIDYSHARDKIMTQSLNRIINTSVHSLFWRETIKSLGEGMRRYLPLKTSKVNKYLLGEGRRLYYSGMSLGLSIFWEILCLVSKVCLLFKLSLCLEAQTMQKCKKFMKKNTFNK